MGASEGATICAIIAHDDVFAARVHRGRSRLGRCRRCRLGRRHRAAASYGQRRARRLVLERRSATFNPLVRLRTDFDAEMAESLDLVR
jgi:hypothetical protein